ncbi:MAG TPA: hypothetical protein VFY71_10295 [Planctomycetota bacterium]|nr:hypothetical protein [Planctomycetota bacterium]
MQPERARAILGLLADASVSRITMREPMRTSIVSTLAYGTMSAPPFSRQERRTRRQVDMALRGLSTTALRRELARREAGAGRLAKRRDKLARRLATLDAELADLGVNGARRLGRPPGRKTRRRGPGRPKGGRKSHGGLTLMQALEKGVRKGSTVSPAEAAQAAKRAGYKTASKTFGIQVATTLARAAGFKKTGRGQYLRMSDGAAPKAKRGRPAKKAQRGPGRPKGSKNKPRATAAAKPAPAAA